VSFAAITLCVASKRVFIIIIIIIVAFIMDSVRKLLDTPSYTHYLYGGSPKDIIIKVKGKVVPVLP
jgi:hypothetical protein